MDKIVIEGGRKLKGRVPVSGSKNAALPIIAASILTSGWNDFSNIPDLADICTMLKLLEGMGVEVEASKHRVKLKADKVRHAEAPYDLVRTMRASVVVLGPLVARLGYARVSLPGGCAIGARPIDRHLKGLEAMGATITLEGGYVEARAKKLKGAHFRFSDVTVTGTENLMMAACLAEGQTVLENCAREPEVVDLAHALNQMGAFIEGAGTETITIEGVNELSGTEYSIMPDRIEAGTFLIGAAMTEGDVTVEGISEEYVHALVEKLREAGALVDVGEDSIHIKGSSKIHSVDISTQPYPGFATDFQAQFMALMALADGTSVISENIFENRFMHVAELNRMGADIKLEGHTAVVRGVPKLLGAPVMATDLRASASLVLAGLAAEGITEIHRVYHIDRGYEHIERKFRKLGVRVKRAKVKY
ncbi:MAG: UDP-N-acetylglucosamine 1-carboxyvinyltransferase [Deltaproteobacteria bacterium GWA2_45_12]|nr:MAG: UDP-N-acetylglucosamine 1-carboxyvinyltransferase [Deltaproteobacteria bacterium GWA2_45_12]